MVFHDTTNTHDSATHLANSILGFSESSTTEYALAAKARSANHWKGRLALWIWANQKIWNFDDSSRTTFPIATDTLVNGQRDYLLPTNALMIDRVEIRDSAGNYYRLSLMDETEREDALTGYGESSGIPNKYWMQKNSVFVDPAPNTSLLTAASGIRIYIAREVVEFTGSTTTTEIGFGEPIDRIVPIGMALDYAGPRGMDDIIKWCKEQLWGEGGQERPSPGSLFGQAAFWAANRARDPKRTLDFNRDTFE